MTPAPTFLSVALPSEGSTLVPSLQKALLSMLAVAVVGSLPEKALIEFERVLEEGDEHAIIAFLELNMPQAHDDVRALVERFRERLAALATP